MKKTFLALIGICLVLGACGSSQNDEVDRGVRYLALTGRTFIFFFQDDLSSCDQFFEVYDQITEETQTCDNEGNFSVTKLNAQCLGGSPINAVADFQLEQINCRDSNTDVIAEGVMQLSLEFSTKGNLAFIQTNSLLLNENIFSFDDFRVEIEFSNNDLSCADSANLFVNNEICDVSSDCRNCN